MLQNTSLLTQYLVVLPPKEAEAAPPPSSPQHVLQVLQGAVGAECVGQSLGTLNADGILAQAVGDPGEKTLSSCRAR